MNKELDKLIREFDQGFDQIPFTGTIYDDYKLLLITIKNDKQLNQQMERQKELQKIIMNLTPLRQKALVDAYKRELDQIDFQIDTNEKLIELQQIKYQLELEQDYIKKKIAAWKEEHGFKN